MSRAFRSTAVVAVLASASLLLAGCGGSDDDGPKKQKAAPAVGSQGVNPQPVSRIRQGGTLKLSTAEWITQYNSLQVDGTQGDAASIVLQVEPTLFTFDAKGAAQPDPDFLTSAKVTSTAPQQITYQLNPQAKWSDGKQLSWKDFQAMWKAANGSDDRYLVADSTGYDQISKVERGSTDQQVKVTFTSPYADWQRLFRPLLPAAAISTPEEFNKDWIEKIPITANSWKISKYDKTAQTITTVPDPKWWGAKPKLSSIVYRALDPAAATDAYLNKEIDYTSAILPEDYKRLVKDRDTAIRQAARWDEVHITLGAGHGPLKDVAVRQAVDLAIDRKAITNAFAKDLPFPLKTLNNHFFMPNQQGYQDTAGKWAVRDVDGARKLLDQAGWKDAGAGKPRTKDGQQLTVGYVLSSASTSAQKDQAQLVQQMLGEAGFKVNIQTVPGNDYFTKYVDRGNFDLTSFRNVDEVFPSMLYPVFQQPQGGQVYQNYGRVGSPEVDDLLKKAKSSTDHAESIRLYNEADKKIWESGHSIELYQRPQILAVRKGLANFGASGLADPNYNTIGWLK